MKTALQWHAESASVVLKALETDQKKGLSDAEHKDRLQIFGPNTIEERRRFRFLRLAWDQIKSPLVFVLIIAGFFALFLGEGTDALVIFIAVFINTAIGIYQEGKASEAFDRLKQSITRHTTVIRDGHKKLIRVQTLVPGDIVLLQAGDQVPADLRLLEVRALEANEAILTGEWGAVQKNTNLLSEDARLTDRANMLWS